jgi:hypothetical protein
MLEQLEDLAHQASQLANNSGRIEDIEKVASIQKMITEIKQQAADEANQKLTFKYERWKSLATLLVPLLTVMTLFVTVFIQYLQITVTREANEDTQWRESMKTFASTVTQNTLSDVASTAVLKPFFHSERYKSQAYDVSFLLFSRMGSLEGFRDLYTAAFGVPSWDNIADVTRVARIVDVQLTRIRNIITALEADPKRLERTKAPTPFDANPISTYEKLEDAYHEVISQATLVTADIFSILRSPRAQQHKNIIVDLSEMSLIFGDARNVDFSMAKVRGSSFDRVNVGGAKITPQEIADTTWPGTQWWKADIIERETLKALIENSYPYYFPEEVFAELPISTRDQYVAEVLKLCGRVQMDCKGDDLKYGTPAAATDDGIPPALQITPATNIVVSGIQGEGFSPTSFNYQISSTNGSADYSISGIPSWLSATSTSGTATATPVTVTFTLMNPPPLGTHNATITFTNTVNGNGNTSILATLTLNAGTKNGCKDGGWKNYISFPGPFRNQGQCVSYFAKQ